MRCKMISYDIMGDNSQIPEQLKPYIEKHLKGKVILSISVQTDDISKFSDETRIFVQYYSSADSIAEYIGGKH